ncbi:uncharacterized protein DDB_G0283697-like isoform X2 [Aricia agestis]|uniref:uncharacterized protein DDB_G0283697-like isoform X2 n=1 Tax=Aricia agestis TaxID=91739 RepID=UPI001C20341B|nr:uncharacterized protein DDB_G0283697-like isoform X2 [Aricia agestis]
MSRQEQVSNLQNFLKGVDKDITMILQNLQWDRSSFSKEQIPLTKCKYNEDHKVSLSKLREHEEMCFLKQNDYGPDDVLLPELLDIKSPTVVKFNSNDIKEIVDNAASKEPMFKRGCNREAVLPLTAERLQATYTSDERRAIHDAVVSSVRTIREQDDEFVLLSGMSGATDSDKSWLERLAEQRDRRRRRAKYRAPPKTRNYSLVLRDVISTQMELLSEMNGNSEADESHKHNKNGGVIKKEMDESSQYEGVEYPNTKKDIKSASSSGSYSEKHNERTKRQDRYAEDKYRARYDKYNKFKHNEDSESKRDYDEHHKDKHNDNTESKRNYDNHYKDTDSAGYYDKYNRDKNNEDIESRRYYDKHKKQGQSSRHSSKTEYSKEDANTDDTSRNYSRHTKYTYRERGRSRQESSKDNYTDHRDDKMYKKDKPDKRKRECDEYYEGYTESRHSSSDRRK